MSKSVVAAAVYSALSVWIACFGGVLQKWSCETSEISEHEVTAYHGETVELNCQMLSYGRVVSGCGVCEFLWQTNGMGSAWWTTNATCSSGYVKFNWTPWLDTGADSVRFFFRVTDAKGANYRANGTMSLLGSPYGGAQYLPLPQKVIDFAQVTVENATNAPWAMKGSGGGGVDTNTVKWIVNSEVGGTNAVKSTVSVVSSSATYWNGKQNALPYATNAIPAGVIYNPPWVTESVTNGVSEDVKKKQDALPFTTNVVIVGTTTIVVTNYTVNVDFAMDASTAGSAFWAEGLIFGTNELYATGEWVVITNETTGASVTNKICTFVDATNAVDALVTLTNGINRYNLQSRITSANAGENVVIITNSTAYRWLYYDDISEIVAYSKCVPEIGNSHVAYADETCETKIGTITKDIVSSFYYVILDEERLQVVIDQVYRGNIGIEISAPYCTTSNDVRNIIIEVGVVSNGQESVHFGNDVEGESPASGATLRIGGCAIGEESQNDGGNGTLNIGGSTVNGNGGDGFLNIGGDGGYGGSGTVNIGSQNGGYGTLNVGGTYYGNGTVKIRNGGSELTLTHTGEGDENMTDRISRDAKYAIKNDTQLWQDCVSYQLASNSTASITSPATGSVIQRLNSVESTVGTANAALQRILEGN